MNYVFDLDGTLIDSTKRHYVLLEKLLDGAGLKPENFCGAEYLNYKRDGGNTFSYLKEKLSLPEPLARKISDEWVEHIEDYALIRDYDVLYKDSSAALEKLKADNSIFFLTSRQKAENVTKQLKLLNIFGYAREVIVCSPLQADKNKEEFIRKLDCGGKNTVIVGDTEADYNAAKNVGCGYYILNRGFRSKKFWDEKGVESYADLLSL